MVFTRRHLFPPQSTLSLSNLPHKQQINGLDELYSLFPNLGLGFFLLLPSSSHHKSSVTNRIFVPMEPRDQKENRENESDLGREEASPHQNAPPKLSYALMVTGP